MEKTIREALEYAQQQMDMGDIGRTMAKMMIDAVITNLDAGKNVDDPITF